ncbi:MAG: glycosyltransferase family 2 protein [Planctomycetes bacterium]|nr:glycosyltransferase family 2 protein [Planctomycetota bacterium]
MESANMQAEKHQDITAVAYSFIVPIYNDADILPDFYRQFQKVADSLNEPYEVIFVDDGSTDKSLEVIKQLCQEDDRVKYVSLLWHFGFQAAVAAGCDYATGSAVISFNLESPYFSEVIPQMIARWREGYQIVHAVKINPRMVSRIKQFISRGARKISQWLAGLNVAEGLDYRLLDRRVIEIFRRFPGQYHTVSKLLQQAGCHQATVEYELEAEIEKRSGQTKDKSVKISSLSGFGVSIMLLRLIGIIGAAMMISAIIYALVVIVPLPFSGDLLINLVMLLIGLVGMQLAAIAICGEYVGRMYSETKSQLLYIVQQVGGFEEIEEKLADETTTTSIKSADQPTGIRLFT